MNARDNNLAPRAQPVVDAERFARIADALCVPVDGIDDTSLYLAGETSDFIRFNHALVRQVTQVVQCNATVAVVRGQRRAESTIGLTGDVAADTAALQAERDALAAQLDFVPDDPHLLRPTAVASSQRELPGSLPTVAEVIDTVTREAAGLDLVGFYAGGEVLRAFADTRGQRNGHRADSFLFDWCLYHQADKAVKTDYAGTHWSSSDFAARIAAGRERLALLAQPPKTVPPGAYRCWFTPTAVADLVGMLGWGGFGLKVQRTGTSTLNRLWRGEAQLHAGVTWAEDAAGGIAPDFTPMGFAKPARVPLVEAGRAVGTLASPRSAREFGVDANSGEGESPEALRMEPGTLAEADALQALGTGIYVSNVHYLNYSDRATCRITGMTRFACFWVEGGRLVAPLGVMRFDDTLLRMFGDGLLGLTRELALVPDSSTYAGRQLVASTVPGALVEGVRFTL